MVRPDTVIVPAIELVAVLAGALSGFAEARKKQMDPVGVFTVAFVSAFGGGTLRDLLLDIRPFFWVQHNEYVLLILALTIVAAPALRIARRVFAPAVGIVADAVGLGFFSIAGLTVAREMQSTPLIAAMMGVITGVAGGVLRDVILNDVPMVLRDGKPYALAAFLGCWLYLGLIEVGTAPAVAMWTSAGFIVAVRLAAWRFDWTIK